MVGDDKFKSLILGTLACLNEERTKQRVFINDGVDDLDSAPF
jgi:hypothetical protein